MYFRFNLLVYRFAKKIVEKTNSQTIEKINGVIYLRIEVVHCTSDVGVRL
jgi:hypothetical protein